MAAIVGSYPKPASIFRASGRALLDQVGMTLYDLVKEIGTREFKKRLAWIVGVLLLLEGCALRSADYQVVLDSLNEPRGLWLRADGTLCVAEAGRVAEGHKMERWSAVYRGDTGALSCVDKERNRQRVMEQLPYVFYGYSGVSAGPTDVVDMDGTLYLLIGEGKDDLSRTLLRIKDPTSTAEEVANLLDFAISNATAVYYDERDLATNPFAMIPDPTNERFLVTDGATGQVLSVGLDGKIQLFSGVNGYEVLTGIAWGPDGLPYVASFGGLPHSSGSGQILRLHPDGAFDIARDNLTTPIDLAFDTTGRLYVLEFVYASDEGHPYQGKTGRLLRFDPEGDRWGQSQVLVEGLPYPTALLITSDERVYVSIHGAFSSPQTGAVLRFDHLVQRGRRQSPVVYVEPATRQ